MAATRTIRSIVAIAVVVAIAWHYHARRQPADPQPPQAAKRAASARVISLAPRTPASLAPTTAEVTAPVPPRRYHVWGRVTIGDTAAPCPDAEVTLVGVDRRELRATADADGIDQLDDVLPGRYDVGVSCKDYLGAPSYPAITVTDHDLGDLAWRVERGAAITGRVVLSTGDTVAGASLAVAMVGVDSPVATSGWGRDQSDTSGRFQISGLAPGTYALAIDSAFGVTPVDGFRVVVGEHEVVDRDFALDPAARIDGVVEDTRGAPIANTDVFARSVGTRWSTIATTDAAGRFQLTARPGEYTLLVQRPGRAYFASDDPDADLQLALSAGVTRVTLTGAARDAELRGRVRDAHGLPRADVTVSVVAERARDTREEARFAAISATTDSGGQFVISALTAGDYTVFASAPGGSEVFATHVAAGSVADLRLP